MSCRKGPSLDAGKHILKTGQKSSVIWNRILTTHSPLLVDHLTEVITVELDSGVKPVSQCQQEPNRVVTLWLLHYNFPPEIFQYTWPVHLYKLPACRSNLVWSIMFNIGFAVVLLISNRFNQTSLFWSVNSTFRRWSRSTSFPVILLHVATPQKAPKHLLLNRLRYDARSITPNAFHSAEFATFLDQDWWCQFKTPSRWIKEMIGHSTCDWASCPNLALFHRFHGKLEFRSVGPEPSAQPHKHLMLTDCGNQSGMFLICSVTGFIHPFW